MCANIMTNTYVALRERFSEFYRKLSHTQCKWRHERTLAANFSARAIMEALNSDPAVAGRWVICQQNKTISRSASKCYKLCRAFCEVRALPSAFCQVRARFLWSARLTSRTFFECAHTRPALSSSARKLPELSVQCAHTSSTFSECAHTSRAFFKCAHIPCAFLTRAQFSCAVQIGGWHFNRPTFVMASLPSGHISCRIWWELGKKVRGRCQTASPQQTPVLLGTG